MAQDAALLRAALDSLDPAIVDTDLLFVSAESDGAIEVIRTAAQSGTKVIALAGRTRIAERLSAMEAGAFDLLSTPIAPAELAGRLRLASSGSAMPENLSLLGMDLVIGDTTHALSPREAEVLALLIAARGRAVRHEALLALWGEHAQERQYLRVVFNKLRQRIEPEPDMPRYLLSEPGLGYRMGTGEEAIPL